ncbi:hypothetical protein BaRGS_00000803, partial [Batillaria attramentaria]
LLQLCVIRYQSRPVRCSFAQTLQMMDELMCIVCKHREPFYSHKTTRKAVVLDSPQMSSNTGRIKVNSDTLARVWASIGDTNYLFPRIFTLCRLALSAVSQYPLTHVPKLSFTASLRCRTRSKNVNKISTEKRCRQFCCGNVSRSTRQKKKIATCTKFHGTASNCRLLLASGEKTNVRALTASLSAGLSPLLRH